MTRVCALMTEALSKFVIRESKRIAARDQLTGEPGRRI